MQCVWCVIKTTAASIIALDNSPIEMGKIDFANFLVQQYATVNVFVIIDSQKVTGYHSVSVTIK